MSLCGLHVLLYCRCAVTLLQRLLYILRPVLAKPNCIKSYHTIPNHTHLPKTCSKVTNCLENLLMGTMNYLTKKSKLQLACFFT